MKLLYHTRDRFPFSRVDLSCLFQDRLQGKGLDVSYVAKSDASNNKLLSIPKDVGFSSEAIYRIVLTLRNIQKYNAIQVRDMMFISFVLALISKMCHRKFFLWISWPFPEDDIQKFEYKRGTASLSKRIYYLLRGKIGRIITRANFFLSDVIFLQSHEMRRYFESNYNLDPKKVVVVPMGWILNSLKILTLSQVMIRCLVVFV